MSWKHQEDFCEEQGLTETCDADCDNCIVVRVYDRACEALSKAIDDEFEMLLGESSKEKE